MSRLTLDVIIRNYYRLDGILTTPTPVKGSCPFLWVPYGGYCYYLETTVTDSWLEANVQCVKRQVIVLQ